MLNKTDKEQTLNCELSSMKDWCNFNALIFNDKKTKIMFIDKSRNKGEPTITNFHMSDNMKVLYNAPKQLEVEYKPGPNLQDAS